MIHRIHRAPRKAGSYWRPASADTELDPEKIHSILVSQCLSQPPEKGVAEAHRGLSPLHSRPRPES